MSTGWKWVLGILALVAAVVGCNAPAKDAAECAPGYGRSVDSEYFGRLEIPPLPPLPVREDEIRDGFEAAGFTFSPDEWRESGGSNIVFSTGHYPAREDPDAEMLRIVGTLGSDCPSHLGHIAPADGSPHELKLRYAHRLLLLLLTLPEWEGASEWLNAALPTAHQTGLAETSVQGTAVQLSYETRDGVELYILGLHRPLDEAAGEVSILVSEGVDCPTATEADYFREVGAGIQASATHKRVFLDLMDELDVNPALEYDAWWLGKLSYALIDLRFGATDLADLDGPDSTDRIRSNLALRAKAMGEFVDAWESLINRNDPSQLADSPAALREANRLTKIIVEEIADFCERSG